MKPRNRHAGALLGAALAATLLAGCEILPTAEPVQVLDPQPTPAEATAGRPAAWRLEVAPPQADAMRGGEPVLVRTADGRLQVLGRTRWSAAPPALLRTLLLRHLRDTGTLAEVGTALAGADRRLVIDLRAFELREDGPALAAAVRLEARLYDARSARLMQRRLFAEQAAAESTQGPAVVAAFEAVLGALLPELAAWLAAQPAAD